MSLCLHFQDPAKACACKAGVNYQGLAGGGVFGQIMRLPCVAISNRRGETPSPCAQYQPEPEAP